ncbi:MAG TPA: ABC transporter permease [Oribacterium sp.]|jgi:putative ABC transport system permease protein|nr:ABC transporter permease [Oribacterium sp.]
MSGLLASLLGAISQGLIWSLMVLGVYITFKLLNIADMTTDGSFALGGCICATLMIAGVDPTVAAIAGAAAGGIAGAVTGILHTFFGIPAILAGILTQISLWSINLRIMSDKSNQSVNKIASDITFWVDRLHLTQSQATLVVGLFVVILAISVLYWFFGTELGSALRATGNNEDMIRALGVNTSFAKLLGLIIANVLVGLSGALICQSTKYADVGMGTGAIVIGLASIVIGEVLFGRVRNFALKLNASVIGCIIYFMIRAIVLRLGMKANDMKLLSALIVAMALCIPVLHAKWKASKEYKEIEEDDPVSDGTPMKGEVD